MSVSPRPVPKDFDNEKFVISSYSGSGDTCVGVARRPDGWVAVEHSKEPDQGRLVFGAGWRAFIRSTATDSWTSSS